jgi:hypothetical protein
MTRVTLTYTHRGCAQSPPARGWDETDQLSPIAAAIALLVGGVRRSPRVRRGWLSGPRVIGRRCNRCSPLRGLTRCGISRVS